MNPLHRVGAQRETASRTTEVGPIADVAVELAAAGFALHSCASRYVRAGGA
jgi:hypothetical protein